MKPLAVIALIAFSLSACSPPGSAGASRNAASLLSDDEKHRLYTAGLAASESPLDTDLFKDVCKKIGIFDADGHPNDQYLRFVTEHVDWSLKAESDQFRREVRSKEKARQYVVGNIPQ